MYPGIGTMQKDRQTGGEAGAERDKVIIDVHITEREREREKDIHQAKTGTQVRGVCI